jgi:hypothetical protein
MTESNSINPIGTSSNIVDPSSSSSSSSSSFSSSETRGDPSDPWSFGGYFTPEESKKFQEQMEQNISNQMKKDQQKSKEASEQLKRSMTGEDLYQ